MKSYNKLVTLVVVLVVVIFITSVYSCCSFKPYSSHNVFSNTHSKFENFTEEKEKEKEEVVEGLQGMSDEKEYASINDNKPIDSFSKLEGSLTSEGCAGLTNSQGPLVCNEEQKTLLSTRGGNATGVADQIGSA
jgi:hypothetical protein